MPSPDMFCKENSVYLDQLASQKPADLSLQYISGLGVEKGQLDWEASLSEYTLFSTKLVNQR